MAFILLNRQDVKLIVVDNFQSVKNMIRKNVKKPKTIKILNYDQMIGSRELSKSCSDIIKLIDSKKFKSESERIDFIRNFINTNSIHKIDEEHEKYYKNIPKVLRMMYNYYKTGTNVPHLSCGPRSYAMKSVLNNMGIKSRIIQLFSDDYDAVQGHIFLEVFNRDTNRWEVQDPDYNICYKESNGSERLSAARLIFGNLENVVPCSYDNVRGWKQNKVAHIKKHYLGAAMYWNKKKGKQAKAVYLVNKDRFSITKMFKKNGGVNFIQYTKKHSDYPVIILNQVVNKSDDEPFVVLYKESPKECKEICSKTASNVAMKSKQSMITKLRNGLPFLRKEIEARISLNTPVFLSTPSMYQIVFGHRCNARCITCFQDHKKEPELSGDTVKSLIKQAKNLSKNGFAVTLGGGDPLICEWFYDVLEYAHKQNINYSFTTNGYLLTRENVKRILSFDPFTIGLSIESLDPAINERIRPYKDGTKLVLEGIKNIIEEKDRINSRCGIIIKPVITELNYKSLPKLVRYFGKNSGIIIHPQLYNYYEGLDKSLWIKNLDDFYRVLEELVRLKKEGYALTLSRDMVRACLNHFKMDPEECLRTRKIELNGKKRNCYIGATTLFIDREGNVQFCYYFPPIGNIHRNSLNEIWYSKEAGIQRKEISYCDIACWQACLRPTPMITKIKSFLKLG